MNLMYRPWIATAILLISAVHATAAGVHPPLGFRADLADDEWIFGVPDLCSLPLRTTFGEVRIPLAQVDHVSPHHSADGISVNFINGDRLTGTALLTNILLHGVFGDISVPLAQTVKLAVIEWDALPEATKQAYVSVPHTHYVAGEGAHIPPFTTWDDAATSLVAAVRYSYSGDTVLVANGTYLLASCVDVDRGITLKGSGHPSDTIVDGSGRFRCFSLQHSNAVISALTIRNGYARTGGGVRLAPGTVESCFVISNSATGGGGGIYVDYKGGVVRNCIISGNHAANNGGGVFFNNRGTIANCLVVGNTSAFSGGGIQFYWGGSAKHCTIARNAAAKRGGGILPWGGQVASSIIYSNIAPYGANFDHGNMGPFVHCCTMPMPPKGSGNLSASPGFFSAEHWDFRLKGDSPAHGIGVDFEKLPAVAPGLLRRREIDNCAFQPDKSSVRGKPRR